MTPHRLISILLTFLLLCGLSASPDIRTADASATAPPTPQAESTLLFLPHVRRGFGPSRPLLVSPANGATLNTLIPLFTWKMGYQPTETTGCLAFGTEPQPTVCQMTFDYAENTTQQLAWYNLEAGTTYYWRVGAIYNGDDDDPQWSEEWTFVTVGEGVILPGPAPIAPANDSTVPQGEDVSFQWQPLEGAIEYSLYLHGLDTDLWMGFDTTDVQVRVSAPILLEYGDHYAWFVMARDDYGWGASSATWQFTVVCDGLFCRP